MQDAPTMIVIDQPEIQVVEEMADGTPVGSVAEPIALSRADQMAMSKFRKELELLAAKFILRFFDGKKRRDGGSCFNAEDDRDVLVTKEHIDLALSSETCGGIERFYEIMSESGIQFTKKKQREACIRYLLSILHDAGALGVPKPLIAGIACVHAKLVGRWDDPVDLDDDEDDEAEPDDLELDLIECEMANEGSAFMGFGLGFGGHNW